MDSRVRHLYLNPVFYLGDFRKLPLSFEFHFLTIKESDAVPQNDVVKYNEVIQCLAYHQQLRIS